MATPTADTPVHPLVTWARWIRLGVTRLLSPTASNILSVITAHANHKEGAWPSAALIGKLTGHTRASIFRALKELRSLGLLVSTGRRIRESGGAGPRIYVLAAPPATLDAIERAVLARKTSAKSREVSPAKTSEAASENRGPRHKDGGSVSRKDGGGISQEDGGGLRMDTQNVLTEVAERTHTGEGGSGGEPRTRRSAPLRSAQEGSAPPRAVDGHAEELGGGGGARKEKAGPSEEETVEYLRDHLAEYPVDKRQSIAQYLVMRQYPKELVERALSRVNGGAAR